MKIIKNDYPFKFIIEDKIGKTSGKLYQSISLGLTSVKDKTAPDPKERYKTDWLGFFDEKDLLKLAKLCQTTYDSIKVERERIKEGEKLAKGMVKPNLPETDPNADFVDDSVPF